MNDARPSNWIRALRALLLAIVPIIAGLGAHAVVAQEAADLELAIADDPDPVAVGGQLTYTGCSSPLRCIVSLTFCLRKFSTLWESRFSGYSYARVRKLGRELNPGGIQELLEGWTREGKLVDDGLSR